MGQYSKHYNLANISFEWGAALFAGMEFIALLQCSGLGRAVTSLAQLS